MAGFYDITCPKCGRRIGWSGELKDQPVCKCGYVGSKEETDRLEKIFQEARVEFDKFHADRWAKATPEQKSAFEVGKASYIPGKRMMDKVGENPYSARNSGTKDHELYSWWNEGWTRSQNKYLESQAKEVK